MKNTALYIIVILSCFLCVCCSEDNSMPSIKPEPKYLCYYKSLNKKLSNGKDAATIYIVSRSANNSDSDCVMTFGNKLATANIYFDLKDIFLYSSKDSSLIFEDKNQYRIFGHLTDNIQPIRFRVSQNADGDFANTDQTYFTGGFHGYQNLTDEKASPTLFEKEKYVTVDNHPLAMNQKMAGNHIHIAVTNLIQASNTEKKEGLGRYALKQSITIDYLNDTAFVQINPVKRNVML